MIDTVTLGHDKSGDSGGCNSRGNGVTLLGYVDLAVPAPVGLGGGEHVTAAAHVAEGSLTGTVGTTSAYTGDTCHGTTSTP